PTPNPTPTPAPGSALILSPVPGSTFTSSSVTFTWSAGSGATAYWLLVGSHPGASDIFSSGKLTVRSKTVNNVPVDGRTIYVQLYSFIGGSWASPPQNCTYKAFNPSATPTPTPTPTPAPTPTPTP